LPDQIEKVKKIVARGAFQAQGAYCAPFRVASPAMFNKPYSGGDFMTPFGDRHR
jgi:hypothetical protein